MLKIKDNVDLKAIIKYIDENMELRKQKIYQII